MILNEMPIDVVGIGNALMDILVQVEDDRLAPLKLDKGVFNLVDLEKSQEVFQNIASLNPKICPGGCVSNTVGALSQLGAKAAFFGHVGRDDLGQKYETALKEEGILTHLQFGDGATGSAITLITPDSERTFATHLGSAANLQEIDETVIKRAKVLYVTGYTLEPPLISDVVLKAMKIANDNNVKVCLDVSDPHLIGRMHNRMLAIIRDHVDICFANEAEAEALFQKKPVNAVNELSKICEIAVVKNGADGSYVKKGSEIHHAGIVKVDAIDTTGAGDTYAAGFLYGLVNGKPIDECARIGAEVAARIVSKIGARLTAREVPEIVVSPAQ